MWVLKKTIYLEPAFDDFMVNMFVFVDSIVYAKFKMHYVYVYDR